MGKPREAPMKEETKQGTAFHFYICTGFCSFTEPVACGFSRTPPSQPSISLCLGQEELLRPSFTSLEIVLCSHNI